MRQVLFALLLYAMQASAALNIDLSGIEPASPHVARFVAWATPALTGTAPYGFTSTHAVTLYRLTGNAAWCNLATTRTEAHVAKAEADIATGIKADVSFDSYLNVGSTIEALSVTYQYCPQVTAAQKTRWGAYAEQTVWNIWNPTQAKWGNTLHPWSGWSISNPGNNYHYSFLRATMTWGFVKPEGGTDWIAWLRTNKIPQIITYYTNNGIGGGSREGTGYGMAHSALYSVYKIWKDSTPEHQDLANVTVHLRDSVDYLIHATMPDFKKFAPIGDLSRVSYPTLYDYHRCYMIEARKQAPLPQVNRATWWLNRITPTRMQDGFNFPCGLFDGGGTELAPTALYHHAVSAGHLFARDNWTVDAMWIGMIAGRYDESHAAQDQGSFTIFHKDFLAVTENIFSRSGIHQETNAQNVVRFEKAGAVLPQLRSNPSRSTTMVVTPSSNGAITAEANLSTFYNTADGVQWSRKLAFANKSVEITDTLALGATTTAIWQVNTPVAPVKVTDNSYRAGNMLITVLSPANPQISVVDWKAVSTEYTNGYKLEVRGGTTEYRVLMAATDTVVTPPPIEPPPVVVEPPLPFSYPGYVLKATGVCRSGQSWHYECPARLWVPGNSLLPTDIVAICRNPTGTTLASCANTGSPNYKAWKTVGTLTATDQLVNCSGLPANTTSLTACVAPLAFAWVSQTYVPPPPPVIVPGLFQNVTTAVFDVAPWVDFHFWAGLPDVNGDGCFDAFVAGHLDGNSRMFIQTVVDGKCSGKMEYFPKEDATYAQPGSPRITSRNMFGNWPNRPDGLWSMLGQDADLGDAAFYQVTGLNGNKPTYAPKTTGCRGSRCLFADMDGDGVVEIINASNIVRFDGTQAFTLPANFSTGGIRVIFDLNGDTYPDILNVKGRGYYTYNPASKVIEWRGGIFPETTIDPLMTTGHTIPFDYDNDGDLDLYVGQGHYSPVGADSVVAVHGPNEFYPHLFRNDNGVFTEVTQQAGLAAPGLLKNQYYFTTYTATVPADIDNDGDLDLVMGGEKGTDTADGNTIPLIINNGNSTFKVDRSMKFGGFTGANTSSGRPWTGLGDFDNDGRVDLVKTHGSSSPTHESIALFKNTIVNNNRWLRVRVQGVTTDGLQTRVVISKGGFTVAQEIGAPTSQFTNLIPHFGVGNLETVDVTVHRPHGGPVLTFKDVPTNQDIIISKGGQLRSYTPGSPLIIPDVPPDVPPDEPPPVPPTYAELEAFIEELRADVLRLVGEKGSLADANEELRAQSITLTADVSRLQADLTTLEAEHQELETLNAAQTTLLELSRQEAETLKQPETVILRRTETGFVLEVTE